MADKYVNATGLRAVIDWILSAFTKKKDFDALEIGGRNLLTGTRPKSNPWVFTSSTNDGCNNIISGTGIIYVKPGKTYMISCESDGTWTNVHGGSSHIPSNKDCSLWIYIRKQGTTKDENGFDYARFLGRNYSFTCSEPPYKGRATWTWTALSDAYTIRIRSNIYSDGSTPITVKMWNLKVEEGNKATDWSPAPEDVEAAISDVTNDCIKGLSVSDNTITYTKGDGSKGTIATKDTNTWRGIQNNLTSDSTTDSLAAAQGKALKALVDGKAASSHKHAKSDITDMPTSLPAKGGNADTATKLATARTIALTGSVTGSGAFDGSGNLSIATTTNHTHNLLSDLYSSRPTSANIGATGVCGLSTFIATSAMTSGKPASDAHIIHCYWDTEGWDSQFAILEGARGLQYRNMINGVWTNWHTCGMEVVIGTSSAQIAYKSAYTKALIEFWKTLVGTGTTTSTCSSTVYDSVLVTDLSSSMTAVNGKSINSGPDFSFAYSISTGGAIKPSGNFSKYRITYFN